MRAFTLLRPINALSQQTIARTSRLSTPLRLPSTISSVISLTRSPLFTQTQLRYNSSAPRPLTDTAKNQTEKEAEWAAANQERRKNEEAYQVTFTCKPCGTRSAHRMSKQGYHRGTVLIQCPSCQSRHVMSDHLGVFFDKKTTLEDLLKEKGQTLTHGHTNGDLEFWEDGTVKSYDSEGKEKLESRKEESSEPPKLA